MDSGVSTVAERSEIDSVLGQGIAQIWMNQWNHLMPKCCYI